MRFSSTYLLFPALFLASSLLGSCSDPPPARSSSSGTSGSSNVSAKFGDDVMPILVANCAMTACHGTPNKDANRGILITVDKAQVYAELQKPSPNNNGAKFVVAGKPDDSFIVAKIEGTQGKFPGCNGGCGLRMPQQDDESLQGLPTEDVAVIRKWITNGAKND